MLPIFLNPLFLMFTAVAAVPIALHLLHRRRPKPVPFSTLRFLTEAIAKSRRSRHLTHFLTLLMRVLIVLLLAVAFSQPQVRSVSFIPEGKRTVVIVLDASASMQYMEGETSSFSRAQAWAMKLITSLAEGDRVGVLVPGRGDGRLVFPPISDKDAVYRAVEECEPGYGTVGIAETLSDLLERLPDSRSTQGDEVHMFSDFQATGWDEGAIDALAGRLAKRGLVLFLNRVGPAVVSNAGIAKTVFYPPAVLGDGQFEARVDVRAARDFDGSTAVRLVVGAEEQVERAVRLLPDQVSKVSLVGQVSPDAPTVLGRVELDPDGFALDNTFRFSLPRLAGIPVLLVDGSGRGEGDGRDTFFLKHAIQPRGRSATLFLPEVVDWVTFLSSDISAYSIVYVCNPPAMGESASSKLDQFVRNGGTAVLMPGQNHALEAGLGRLSVTDGLRARKEILPQERAIGLVPSENASRLEKRLLGLVPPPAGLMIRRRLLLDRLPDAAQVAFRFSDGGPFAVELPLGNGSYWVTAVSANRDWSEWPLNPFFVVFQQELIKGSAKRSLSELTGEVGAPLAIEWSGEVTDMDVTVRDAEGRERTVHLSRTDAAKPFIIDAFDRPGVVHLSRGDRDVAIAVNIPAAESELRFLSADELSLPLRGVPHYLSDSWHELQQNLVNVRQGRPLWPLLLCVAFLLAVTEELFANIRSRATVLPEALQQFLKRGGRRG